MNVSITNVIISILWLHLSCGFKIVLCLVLVLPLNLTNVAAVVIAIGYLLIALTRVDRLQVKYE